MSRWLALLLLSCGGIAESAPLHGWCCEVPGADAVECGQERKTEAVCYCAGVVDIFTGSCE